MTAQEPAATTTPRVPFPIVCDEGGSLGIVLRRLPISRCTGPGINDIVRQHVYVIDDIFEGGQAARKVPADQTLRSGECLLGVEVGSNPPRFDIAKLGMKELRQLLVSPTRPITLYILQHPGIECTWAATVAVVVAQKAAARAALLATYAEQVTREAAAVVMAHHQRTIAASYGALLMAQGIEPGAAAATVAAAAVAVAVRQQQQQHRGQQHLGQQHRGQQQHGQQQQLPVVHGAAAPLPTAAPAPSLPLMPVPASVEGVLLPILKAHKTDDALLLMSLIRAQLVRGPGKGADRSFRLGAVDWSAVAHGMRGRPDSLGIEWSTEKCQYLANALLISTGNGRLGKAIPVQRSSSNSSSSSSGGGGKRQRTGEGSPFSPHQVVVPAAALEPQLSLD